MIYDIYLDIDIGSTWLNISWIYDIYLDIDIGSTWLNISWIYVIYLDIDIGSTWLNISWLLHCEISPEDVLFVRRYRLQKDYSKTTVRLQ